MCRGKSSLLSRILLYNLYNKYKMLEIKKKNNIKSMQTYCSSDTRTSYATIFTCCSCVGHPKEFSFSQNTTHPRHSHHKHTQLLLTVPVLPHPGDTFSISEMVQLMTHTEIQLCMHRFLYPTKIFVIAGSPGYRAIQNKQSPYHENKTNYQTWLLTHHVRLFNPFANQILIF